MARAALLSLLLVFAACSSGGKPAAETPDPKPAGPAPCDYKIVALSDPGQKQIQCANGESFVLRQGPDGKWQEEMRVRAGMRPSYSTLEEAARARCCGAAE
jgi:hypothetical protein